MRKRKKQKTTTNLKHNRPSMNHKRKLNKSYTINQAGASVRYLQILRQCCTEFSTSISITMNTSVNSINLYITHLLDPPLGMQTIYQYQSK